MRLRRMRDHATTGPSCRLCLGSGRVPYAGNHFQLWMVPCHGCRGTV